MQKDTSKLQSYLSGNWIAIDSAVIFFNLNEVKTRLSFIRARIPRKGIDFIYL